MLNQYLKAIIPVIIIVVILFAIVMVSNIEFSKIKTKTHTYEEIPGFVKESLKTKTEALSERGLYFYSDVNQPTEFIVDVDKKTIKYSLTSVVLKPENMEGTLKLSDKQLNEIVSLVNKIWASESDFESENYTARITSSFLVLADKGVYRQFDFSGLLEGEVQQLHSQLLNLVPK